MAGKMTTSGCVPIKMGPRSGGTYATCSHFCTSKCFGRCTPSANCPDSLNKTCDEVAKYPDFSGGACCQSARLTNNTNLDCDKKLTEEQLRLVTAPSSGNSSSPKVEVECCCTDHTCPVSPQGPRSPASSPAPAPPTKVIVPESDKKNNITVSSDMYQTLLSKRALLMNTKTPRAPKAQYTPPPIGKMPPILANNSQSGACLVYAPAGCKPGTDNPFDGQVFPSAGKTKWVQIESYNPKNTEKLSAEDWGKTRCLGSLRSNWHNWCNSKPSEKNMNLQPVFTVFCVSDGQCFSDSKCIDRPDQCAK